MDNSTPNQRCELCFARMENGKCVACGGVVPIPSPPIHAPSVFQFFAFDHLPPHLAAVSGDFYKLACGLMATLPANSERNAALRKLLEAKDCAVRAVLYKETYLDG